MGLQRTLGRWCAASVHTLLGLAALAGAALAHAGAMSTERQEGLRDGTPQWHALTGARIVLSPGQVIERGTVLLRDGRIVAAAADLAVPAGARVWHLPGRTVYAGFIDLSSEVGVPAAWRAQARSAPPATVAEGGQQRQPATAPGADASMVAAQAGNPMVRPERSVAARLELRADELRLARELGFTAVLASPGRGVFRGQAALLATAEVADPKDAVLLADAAQLQAHEFNRGGRLHYPNSLMGAIALSRQTWSDARWWGSLRPEQRQVNLSLQALQAPLQRRQTVIYQADDEQDYLRAARVVQEFGLRAALLGNGHEYRRAAQLRQLGLPVIVPLLYPAAPEVDNPDTAADLTLQQLQHWELAPSNLSVLARSGVEFALTARGLVDARREFWPRLRQAVARGLSPELALAALTTVPAKLLGQPQLGEIAPGRAAHLVVARGDLFTDEDAQIELSFIDGRAVPTAQWQRPDLQGRWALTLDGQTSMLEIVGTAAAPAVRIAEKKCESHWRSERLHLRWPCGDAQGQWLTLALDGEQLQLTGAQGSPAASRGQARRVGTASAEPRQAAAAKEPAPDLAALQRYPAGAYGREGAPFAPPVLLLRGATLWTSAAAGRLEDTDLLVRDGRIAAIGKQLQAPAGAHEIDARGKHVTPGLIDAHSHTAIARGVNEATSSVSAEVRVGDVLDATDINIYRSLAGGLTTANLLHGSANTIGGQSQVIKLRWGEDAEGLKFKEAPPGIKFALGENVKQSNWGDANNTRYPQTRMGVEQLLRDAFQAAQAYRQRWADWRRAPAQSTPPRRDLQLDTLVELLERKRHIHIHAYRADEILMFTRIAREFGLSVAAFQHVLEGYKVASEIASIGAGSSTFSDWWAFKMEVMDAIPYNGAIMQRAGVLTSFNSDSNELARRLNTEAAKAVRWGGLDEAEALKFVTANPAQQLGIASRTGTLEAGKDADLVIWSGHPLATSSKAEQTWIEGRRYFDLASDARLRAEHRRERERLLAKALPARLQALAREGGARSVTPASDPLALALAELRWRRLQHEQARYADSYGNNEWHECTAEELQP